MDTAKFIADGFMFFGYIIFLCVGFLLWLTIWFGVVGSLIERQGVKDVSTWLWLTFLPTTGLLCFAIGQIILSVTK